MSGLLAGVKEGLSIPARLIDRLYRTFCGTWYAVTVFGIMYSRAQPFTLLADLVGRMWPSAGWAMNNFLNGIDNYHAYFAWGSAIAIGLLVLYLLGRTLPVEERRQTDTGRTGSTLLFFIMLLQQSFPVDWSIWSWWWIGCIPFILFGISAISARFDNQRTASAVLSAVAWPIQEVWNLLVGDATTRPSTTPQMVAEGARIVRM